MGNQQTELTKTKKSLSLALNVRLKPCAPLVADVAAVQVQRPQRGGPRHARLRATRQRFELYVLCKGCHVAGSQAETAPAVVELPLGWI